jgi:hypothetical protein
LNSKGLTEKIKRFCPVYNLFIFGLFIREHRIMFYPKESQPQLDDKKPPSAPLKNNRSRRFLLMFQKQLFAHIFD